MGFVGEAILAHTLVEGGLTSFEAILHIATLARCSALVTLC